jgi:hypothetical protein
MCSGRGSSFCSTIDVRHVYLFTNSVISISFLYNDPPPVGDRDKFKHTLFVLGTVVVPSLVFVLGTVVDLSLVFVLGTVVVPSLVFVLGTVESLVETRG